jgi:hypothetical protein
MPNLAQFHPQIVHFVVALLVVGVAFRIVSLTGRLTFTNYAATSLLVIGALAAVFAVFAVQSGTDAHGPVERIPGTRELVMQHERQGKTTRNFFLALDKPDSARAALAPVVAAFPQNTRLKAKMDSIK